MSQALKEKRGVTIAVDAMGGDFAPDVNIRGAVMATSQVDGLSVVLVGDEKVIKPKLHSQLKGLHNKRVSSLHAEEVISMEDHGASVIRKKKLSSIHIGLNLVKEQKANAFISAGNSGAVMATALLVLGRLAQIERPAILIRLPTAEGYISILDGGANVDCRASQLEQFAEMGHIYAQAIEGIDKPRIALLSNGTEFHKGNDLTREAQALLRKRKDLNYVGYVEGYHLFQGSADVVVCDGFVGNVTLKLAEGLSTMAFEWLRKEVKKDLLGLLGVALMRNVLRRFKENFDYERYGAAPLVGTNGLVLISHGASSEKAIQNGILTAKRMVESRFNERMVQQLESHQK